MRRFLLTNLALILLVAASHLVAILSAGGRFDPYYVRFTSPKQQSLILGTSKAAQGVVPSILDTIIDNYDGPFFNYSFTIDTSPFGSTYLESVKNKLDSGTSNGIFVITVDPWSISSTLQEKRRQMDRESGFLDKIENPNQNPNFDYFFHNFKKSWGRVFIDNLANVREYLHPNGWLEIYYSPDEEELSYKAMNKLKLYKRRTENFEFSETRLKYLEQTITTLLPHGSVYLVRLPIDKEMQILESDFMPEFDNEMIKLQEMYRTPYFNYFGKAAAFTYKDGNHLTRESAMAFSKLLANEIRAHRTY